MEKKGFLALFSSQFGRKPCSSGTIPSGERRGEGAFEGRRASFLASPEEGEAKKKKKKKKKSEDGDDFGPQDKSYFLGGRSLGRR